MADLPFDIVPEWDSPDYDHFQNGCTFALAVLASLMGAEQWEGGDGTEALEGDIGVEIGNIFRAAGYCNADGDPFYLVGKGGNPAEEAAK